MNTVEIIETVKQYNQAIDDYTPLFSSRQQAEKMVITSILSDVQQLLSYMSPDALEMANEKLNDLKRCINYKG